MIPQVNKETIVRMLELIMPDAHEQLANIGKSGGWIKLSDDFIDVLIQHKFNWWLYYENEQLLKALGATMFLDNDEARELYENTPRDDLYHQ